MDMRQRDDFHTSLPPPTAFVCLSTDVDVLERRRASRRVPYNTDACQTQVAPEFALEVFLCVCTQLALGVRRDSRG
jgi:hypothetical protein